MQEYMRFPDSSEYNPLPIEEVFELIPPEEIKHLQRDLSDAIIDYMDEHRCSADEAKSKMVGTLECNEYRYYIGIIPNNEGGGYECFNHKPISPRK